MDIQLGKGRIFEPNPGPDAGAATVEKVLRLLGPFRR
jgi:hypothetical protein